MKGEPGALLEDDFEDERLQVFDPVAEGFAHRASLWQLVEDRASGSSRRGNIQRSTFNSEHPTGHALETS